MKKKIGFFTVLLLFVIQFLFPQQTVTSEDVIPVDWSSREASAIINEVMREAFSYLSRFEYYHISFSTNNNSATSFWTNSVTFQTRQNPSETRITMNFNYYQIIIHFSDQRLISLGGTEFSESWFRGLVAQNRFRREFNEVLNRISLRMRGMTFGNSSRQNTDRRWLESLHLPMR